jgi:taurine dioxygenase
MVRFEKLSTHTGAVISDFDLCAPLPPDEITEIYRIFLDHAVVLFRDQHFAQEDLVRATQLFGNCGEYDRPKKFHTAGQERVLPQIMLITNVREDGKPIGALPDGEMWFHHDTIHREIPHNATLLYAVEVPSHGGNTVFSNLFAAYEALPDDLKSALDGRMALNAFSYGSQKKADPNAVAARSQAIHPAIRTHEETGRKAIYVDRLMTQSLLDLPADESDDILARTFDHIERPDFLYEHQWQKGDLVMWDNRSSIHARRDFPADQVRMMWRTTLAGDTRPY